MTKKIKLIIAATIICIISGFVFFLHYQKPAVKGFTAAPVKQVNRLSDIRQFIVVKKCVEERKVKGGKIIKIERCRIILKKIHNSKGGNYEHR
jgi:hypothetical protein